MSDPLEVFRLDGRSAVVCGAGSDMGRAIAATLTGVGASVILGDIDEARLEATRADLRTQGAEVEAHVTDVTRMQDLDALVDRAVARTGGLDIMVNLAGIIHDGRVVDTSEADLSLVLDINLKGMYFSCQAAARAMLARGSGSIVNMASAAAFGAYPNLSCYSMSKAGVVALTRVLAAEISPNGVRVNAIAPGYIEGGMTARRARRPDGSIDTEKLAEDRERARRRNPLRITGEPEDVANAVLFLASDASRYLTGQVLHPNGGSVMA